MNILTQLENTIALSLSESWSHLSSEFIDSPLAICNLEETSSENLDFLNELTCLIIGPGLFNSCKN